MSDLVWYVARTNIRCEDRAKKGLKAAEIVVYLPMEPVWRGRGKDREKVERPLLSRHLFFAVPNGENRFEEVRTTDGIEAILTCGRYGPPQPVRYREIAIVQTAQGELEDAFENATRAAERKATMKDDTDEFVERLKAAKPDERALMIVELLGRGTKARVPLAELQKLAYTGS